MNSNDSNNDDSSSNDSNDIEAGLSEPSKNPDPTMITSTKSSDLDNTATINDPYDVDQSSDVADSSDVGDSSDINNNPNVINSSPDDNHSQTTHKQNTIEQIGDADINNVTDSFAIINDANQCDRIEEGIEKNLICTDGPSLIKTNKELSSSIWLQIYLCGVVFCNFLFLFLDGSGDIGFWEDWIKQLSVNGYTNFNGNYPPLYIHWLYLAGKFYHYFNLTIENNTLLKYLTQIPILLSHFLLTLIIFNLVNKKSVSKQHFHAAMILTAFNPAIIFNGPIWGQIDIIPLIPVIAALFAGVSRRYQILTFPCYAIALLIKFQMIAFAPAFGVLFFYRFKTHLLGALLCIPTLAIAFLPFIVTHSFWPAFKLAYLDVLHQYGATTMGAANIWILLTGNAAPDTTLLFGTRPESALAVFFKAKNFGMITFVVICLSVFSIGIKKVMSKTLVEGSQHPAANILFLAMICTMAFFTLLPAMHERYLLPAVIIALVYFAVSPTKIIYPLAFSFISAFNLAMCLGIKTNGVWPIIAWFMLLIFMYGIFELLLKKSWQEYSKKILVSILNIKWLAVWVLLLGLASMTYSLYQKTKINTVALANNEILLSSLRPDVVNQDYGSLRTNLSINGNTLSIGGKRYANGFGSHANSTIDFTLPPNTQTFSFMAGLDNEVESASVIFSVWGDDKQLWESPPHYGAEKSIPLVTLNVQDIKKLSLKISSMQDKDNDHADWVNPIITLKTTEISDPSH